jgi:hypothetical protein
MSECHELARLIIRKKGLEISEDRFLAVFDKIISSSFVQVGEQDPERPLQRLDHLED